MDPDIEMELSSLIAFDRDGLIPEALQSCLLWPYRPEFMLDEMHLCIVRWLGWLDTRMLLRDFLNEMNAAADPCWFFIHLPVLRGCVTVRNGQMIFKENIGIDTQHAIENYVNSERSVYVIWKE